MPEPESPPEEIVDVLEPDAIGAVEQPEFTTDPDLDDGAPIVGVAVGDRARAYPIAILDWHEIVNDRVGDLPVAVTWCPLCGTGLAFDRRVGDRTLTFGVSGKLYKNDLVMYDRETGSLWSQLPGVAIDGALAGTELATVATDVAEWGAWRERFPDAEVLAPPAGPRPYADQPVDYGRDPHGSYAEDHDDIRFPVGHVDDRLPAKTRVLGAPDPEPVAYPLRKLPDPGVVEDGDRIVVRVDGTVRVFATDRDWHLEDGDLVDDAGRRADPVSGGDGLAPLDHRYAYWFTWADFFPETRIWEG